MFSSFGESMTIDRARNSHIPNSARYLWNQALKRQRFHPWGGKRGLYPGDDLERGDKSVLESSEETEFSPEAQEDSRKEDMSRLNEILNGLSDRMDRQRRKFHPWGGR